MSTKNRQQSKKLRSKTLMRLIDIFEKHSTAQIYIVGKAGLPETENISEGATFVFHSKKCKSANNTLTGLSNICENYKIPLSRWFKEKNKEFLGFSIEILRLFLI